MPKSYVFKKETTKDQLPEQIYFFSGRARGGGVIPGPRDGLSPESIARFFFPASLCQSIFNSVRFLLLVYTFMMCSYFCIFFHCYREYISLCCQGYDGAISLDA